MFKKSFKLRNVVKIGVACLAVCMMFSGCDDEKIEPLSDEKQMISFSFAVPYAEGYIDEYAKTVSVQAPEGTNVTALAPTITVSDKATVTPASGVAQNFTNPVSYTVKAEDGSTESYTVTVTVEESGGGDDDDRYAYHLPENVLIEYEMENVLGITKSTMIKIGNDYYMITTGIGGMFAEAYFVEENGVWTEIGRFGVSNSSGTVIGPWEPTGRSCDNLEDVKRHVRTHYLTWMAEDPNYLAIANPLATVVGNETVAGVPTTKYRLDNYESVGTYILNHHPATNLFFKATLTAGSATSRGEVTTWDTTVTDFGDIDDFSSEEKQIISFWIDAPPYVEGIIDEEAKTISVEVPKGTDVTVLAPDITVSDDATVSPASGVPQNFTNPVIYTVTAKNGRTAKYTVTVSEHSSKYWYELPENVLIEHFERDDYLTLQFTFIKIGKDYFTSAALGGVVYREKFLKHSNGIWTEYERMRMENEATPWTSTDVVVDDLEHLTESTVRGYLLFLAWYDNYDLDENATNLGNETIAGVQTTAYKTGNNTFNRSPEFNLFFKFTLSDNNEVVRHYEVTTWDTTVTSFGDIVLP